MTNDELQQLVFRAKVAARRVGTEGFIACRGEIEGQRAALIWRFGTTADAERFKLEREMLNSGFRVEILQNAPKEVREYRQSVV
jgi:hypothetical protein